MENILKLYKQAFAKLPKPCKTKINRSELDRGGDGVFTKRRKRSDTVLVYFESFVKNYSSNYTNLDRIFTGGWYILCSPLEYFSNLELLENLSVVVRYQTYLELEQYPSIIDWESISSNRHDYRRGDTIFVQDIKNLDKTAKKGKTIYVGPSLIGQHEMDFASEEEILKVKISLLYQMTKMVDFEKFHVSKDLEIFREFSKEFEKTTIFTENPKLVEYTNSYGNTICPELIKFNVLEFALVKFSDIVHGEIEKDVGREDFNRTTTKVNLHHVDKLISGKQNHNHKNVFLGTACGNTVNAAFEMHGTSLSEMLKKISKP